MQIIPIKDLRNTTEISERCHKDPEPIFITKNGYGDMVIMSLEVYNQIVSDRRVDFAIDDYEQELKSCEGIFDIDEVLKNLRKGYQDE